MVVDVKIDYDRCTSCKECVEACTFGVLEWFENRPIVVNPSNCSACLECKSSCSAEAISVEEK
jgi:NAD-dependent dihydropyrimidine dehydrogenase PreA subunit